MKNGSSAGKRLKELMKEDVLVIPGAYDALSAHLIKQAGFQAAYLTGAGLSVSLLGRPDIGLLTMDEVVDTTRRVTRAVDIPFLVDADTGFGGEINVARTVRELEQAGAAGVQIEDQEFPKRCGHLSGKKLIPTEAMVAKIKAAVTARRDPNFCIVARTDARGVKGIRAALVRAAVYKKAGADIIFPEALQTREEFEIFGQKKGLGVLLANMTEFGRSPALTVQELSRLGYRLVLFPMTAFRVAAFAIERALGRLQSKGQTHSLLGQMQTRAELYELIGYAQYDAREKEFLRKK